MALSSTSLRRPVAMTCLLIALTFLGGNAYRKMGLELMPKVDAPYITVVTVWPGATPKDLETDVAKKIEDAVSAVDGLKHVTSVCLENMVQSVLEFQLGVDVNVVATDVREKIDLKMDEFPDGVEKPIIQKFNVNSSPIVTLALTGDLTLDQMYDYADNTLRDQLSIIPGVANVELLGGAKREVHVLLQRDALGAAGLTSLSVVKALQEGVNSLPSGRLQERGTEYAVRFDAEYQKVEELGGLQVAGKDGARRFIRDLGAVQMGTEERRQAVFLDGVPGIGIRVVKKADANTVEVVNNVQKAVERLNRNFPGGLKLTWVHDDGSYIQASVDSTVGNIWQGVLLTAAILFFFLYNVRSTFVVAISMPLTIVVSLFFLQLLGYTLNTSTLLAIGLSVGILVSNSLVVLESVLTHFHRTGDPWQAARDGSAEVGTAVIASAGTNIVVLLPIGLMGSMVGLFFRPFAFTSLLVNVVSIFISFTLTPILCALLLKATSNDQAFLLRMERWWNGKLQGVAHRYAAFLRKLVRHRWVALGMLGGVVLLFLHAMSLGSAVGFSFAPDLDRGTVYVKLEYPTRLDLETTTRRTAEAEALLKDLPGLTHVFTSIGKVDARIGSAGEGVYLAQLLVKFVGKSERTQTADELVDEMRRRLATLPDTIATVSVPGLVGGQSSPVEVEIRGEDIGELNRLALQFQDMVKEIPGFVDPDTTVRVGKPELRVLPQRAILADMNMAPQDLGLLLRANLEGLKAGTYKSGASTFDIRVKLAGEPGKSQVSEFQLPAGQGSPVILSNFTSIQEQEAPVQITRSDKQRVSKLMADLGPELPLGTAVTLLSQRIDAAALLPPGYDYRFRGDYEIMSEAGAAFAEAGLLAVLLTYLALSAIMESFTWSLLILTTVPLGLVGVLWALYLTGTSMSIFVLLGVVMLVGIVVNNAILVIDRMRLLRDGGMDPVEAMYQALEDSFRAVVMVTLAAVLGMLPLAVASGLGSELNNGIGIASAGGIAISSLLALFVVPLIFLVGKTFRRKKESPSA